MRKTKSIKIDDLEIEVKELRVKDIRKIADSLSNFEDIGQALELLPMATNLSKEKLDDMAPSELGQVWDAFKEVNAFFLNLLEKTGVMAALKSSVLNNLTESFAELSSPDTAAALSTGSGSSLPPMKKPSG